MDGYTEHHAEHPAEHGAGNTPLPWHKPARSVDNPDDRSARSTERSTEHNGTPAGTEAVATEHPTERQPEHLRPGAFRRWRNTRRDRAERSAQERNIARQNREDERNAERRRAEQTRSAAAKAAVRPRRGTRNTEQQTNDELAPLPRWMRATGVWISRIFGSLPLVAPLLVSGWFTANVFVDKPLNTPILAAIVITLALEGGLFKLVTLESKTLLEGDSTIAYRILIGVWVTIIGGMIFAHAVVVAAGDQGKGMDQLAEVDLGWGWVPAAGSAAFSVLGVAIYRREARFEHRAALRAKGRIDRQAPKFSLLSWVVTPWETYWAFRHAIKFRLERPLDAINDYRYWKAAGGPRLWPDPNELAAAAEVDTVELINRIAVASPVLARALALRYADALDDAATDGTLSEVLAPTTLLRMERDLGGTLHRGTRSIGPAPVSAPPALPAALGVPLAERNTERSAERNGTRNGAPDTTEQHGTAHGAPGVDADGMRSAPQPDGTDGADGTPVPHLSHVLVITGAFRNWQQEMPSIRKALAAVDAHERNRGNDRGFSSMSTINSVIKYLRTVQKDPEFARTLEALRTQKHPK